MDEEEYTRMLREAIRDRILNEVRKPRDVERIVNNVYGGALTGSDKNQGLGGGVTGEMAKDMTPEELDYYVKISREDMDELNPLTGKPKGWVKKVKRFTRPKGSPDEFGFDPDIEPNEKKKSKLGK